MRQVSTRTVKSRLTRKDFHSMLRLASLHITRATSLAKPARPSTTRRLVQRRSSPSMALSWDAISERKSKVLDELFSIGTTTEIIREHGVDFTIRVASSLAKKPPTASSTASAVPTDPFENPPSQKLFGGPITATHSFIFNKFNLVDNHMVIVTNEFESQYEKLTVADMEAAWKCVSELNGLCFFNGGRLAGASQSHKHLQLVPTPIVDGSEHATPMEVLLLGRPGNPVEPFKPAILPDLPFFNLFARVSAATQELDTPKLLHQLYTDMLNLAEPQYIRNGIEQPWCFNLLLTKSWMLIVPRSKECVDDTTISINSMGYAGTLFVKSQEHYEIVKKIGPMGVLQALSLPHSVPASL